MLYKAGYVTLQRVKSNKGIESTSDDSLLLQAIYSASSIIENYTRRVFYPYKATFSYDVEDLQLLVMFQDLLTVTSITDTDTLTASEYALLPNNSFPKTQIARKASVWNFQTSPLQAVSIEGVWGYHNNPASMFGSIATLDGGITDSQTSLTLSSALSISYPNIIQVGSEYMEVTGEAGAVLTVTRGAYGTEASSHSAGAVVSLFSCVPDIVNITSTLSIYLYEVRDSFGEQVSSMDGTFIVSRVLPSTVVTVLNSYYRQAGSVGAV